MYIYVYLYVHIAIYVNIYIYILILIFIISYYHFLLCLVVFCCYLFIISYYLISLTTNMSICWRIGTQGSYLSTCIGPSASLCHQVVVCCFLLLLWRIITLLFEIVSFKKKHIFSLNIKVVHEIRKNMIFINNCCFIRKEH